jgi:hypothetical protein
VVIKLYSRFLVLSHPVWSLHLLGIWWALVLSGGRVPSWKWMSLGPKLSPCVTDWPGECSYSPLWVFISSSAQWDHWARWSSNYSGDLGSSILSPCNCEHLAFTSRLAPGDGPPCLPRPLPRQRKDPRGKFWPIALLTSQVLRTQSMWAVWASTRIGTWNNAFSALACKRFLN